jgi:acyl-CoA thioesterase II
MRQISPPEPTDLDLTMTAKKPTSPKSAKSGGKTGDTTAPSASAPGAARGTALDGLVSILDLEPLEHNLFRGRSPKEGWQRVYGGQVLGQALVAAVRTVEPDRIAHSMHAYFLLAGDPKVPIIYEVERIRDGGSFTTRRVKGIQHGRAMFAMSVSFQKAEAGYEHAARMPDVPPPEDLPSEHDLISQILKSVPDNMRSYWERERPIEMRPVDVSRYLAREKHEPVQHLWMRANGKLPDAFPLHQCVLAYASDFTLLDTALIAHGKLLFDADIQLASLDHALWFHRPFRADDWLLYVQDSPSAHGARGFCRGSVFTRDGVLVASVTQEGLMRKRSTAFMVK